MKSSGPHLGATGQDKTRQIGGWTILLVFVNPPRQEDIGSISEIRVIYRENSGLPANKRRHGATMANMSAPLCIEKERNGKIRRTCFL